MKLALGTVQFGMNYGVTNTSGQVEKNEVNSILEYAYENELRILDTAAAYGNSESILGELASKDFKIISKIPRIETLNHEIGRCIDESLLKLNRNFLYGLMFHDENDFFNKAEAYQELIKAKERGLVRKIGCSFYSIEALLKCLKGTQEIDIIQIPSNCLDQRFANSGVLERAKEKGIEIHCRSLFLQGLLLDENTKLPATLIPYKEELLLFFDFCREHQVSPLEATLKYLQQSEFIDYGVVGCLSRDQIIEIIQSYSSAEKLTTQIDFSGLSSDTIKLLNPSLWN